MKRLVALAVVALGILAAPATAAHADSYGESLCQERPFMCLDPFHSIGKNGAYTGHDEPTVQFSSHRPGTGGKRLHVLRHAAEESADEAQPSRHRRDVGLPAARDVLVGPHALRHRVLAELHEDVHAEQRRNAVFRSSNAHSPHFIGKGPGNAFIELQFYSPGWVPQFTGFGCSATKLVRQPDHRQPVGQRQHRRAAERATA